MSQLFQEIIRFWRGSSPSRILFSATFGFILGVFLASVASLPHLPLVALSGVILVATVIKRAWRYWLLFVFVAALCIGASRRTLVDYELSQSGLRASLGQTISWRGMVSSVPTAGPRSQHFRFQTTFGEIKVVARPFPEVIMGDRLSFNCKLAEEEQQRFVCIFPEQVRRTSHDDLLATPLFFVRDRFVQSIQRVFPEPSAGFLSGLLVGGSAGLSEHWRGALRTTGTAHLVALSGYNVSILGSVLLSILSACLVPRQWRLPAVAIFLTLFVIMVGAAASIVRAALMGMLVVLARHLGRSSHIRNSIAFTAALMLAHDPTILVFDLGFQLSFLATIAMVTIYPRFEEQTKHWPILHGAKDAFLMAIAAELLVTPLLLYHFGELSIISPVVNAIVVPFIPFLMLSGFVGGLAGFIAVPLGQVIGFLGWVAASFVLQVIATAAELPLSSVPLHLPLFVVGLYYLVVALVFWRFSRNKLAI